MKHLTGTGLLVGVILSVNAVGADMVYLPAIGNATDTGFQYGVVVMRLSDSQYQRGQNQIQAVVQQTTKDQQQALLDTTWRLNPRWGINTGIKYRNWPTNFYTIGNEIQENSDSIGEVGASAWLNGNYYLDPANSVNFSVSFNQHNLDLADAQYLTSDVLGFDGGNYVHFGVEVEQDFRDVPSWPTQGTHFDMGINYSLGGEGEHSFFRFHTQYAEHMNVGAGKTFSGKIMAKYANDSTPFNYLPTPDGSRLLRTAERGKFKDNLLLGAQLEWRQVISDKFAWVGFGDMAQVAPTREDFEFKDSHWAVGMGLRWSISSSNRYNVRLDVAQTDEGFGTFVLDLGESF